MFINNAEPTRMGFTWWQGHVPLSSPVSSAAESDALILVVEAEASSAPTC